MRRWTARLDQFTGSGRPGGRPARLTKHYATTEDLSVARSYFFASGFPFMQVAGPAPICSMTSDGSSQAPRFIGTVPEIDPASTAFLS